MGVRSSNTQDENSDKHQNQQQNLQTEEILIQSPLFDQKQQYQKTLMMMQSTFKADEVMHNFITKNHTTKSLNRYEKFKRNHRLAILNQSLDLQQDSQFSTNNSKFHHQTSFDNTLQGFSRDTNNQNYLCSQQNSRSIKDSYLLNQTATSMKTSGYKEFRITTDLKEIDKWLDQKEIHMEELKKEMLTEGGKQQEQERYMVQYYSVFHSALQEILKLLPENKFQDLISLLSRIHTGYKDCFSLFQQKLKQLYTQSQEQMAKMREDFKELQGRHEDFQRDNDLNRYFTKNLDAGTREKVIKDIQELLSSDNTIQLDKNLLQGYKFSESTRTLTDINSEYEHTLKERLNFYMHQNEKDQESQAPLPSNTFTLQFNNKLNSNYNFAVHTTAKKIVQRLLAQYKKPTAECSVQTSSFDEIKMQFETQIRSLERLLEDKEHEKEQILQEIEKAKMKLDKINKEKKRLQAEYDEIYATLDSQKEQQKSMSNENIELRSQLKAVQKKMHKLEELDKLKDQKIKQLMDENYEFKQQVSKLTSKVNKYKKKLENAASKVQDPEQNKLPKYNPKDHAGKNKLGLTVTKPQARQSDSQIPSPNKINSQQFDLENSSEQSQAKMQKDSPSRGQGSQFSAASQMAEAIKKNIANRITAQMNNNSGSGDNIDRQISGSPNPRKDNNEMEQQNLFNNRSNLKSTDIKSTNDKGDLKIPNSQSNNQKINSRNPSRGKQRDNSSASGNQQQNLKSNNQRSGAGSHNKTQSLDASLNKQGNQRQGRSSVPEQQTQAKYINERGKQISNNAIAQTSTSQLSQSMNGANGGSGSLTLINGQVESNSDLKHLKSFANIKSNLELQEIQEEEHQERSRKAVAQQQFQQQQQRGPINKFIYDNDSQAENNLAGSPISKMQAKYGAQRQDKLTSIIPSPRHEREGVQDEFVQTLIRGNMLEDFVVNEEEVINNIVLSPKNKKNWNESCQTESFEYVDYMSTLYYNELRLQLKDELNQHESAQLKILLEKSRKIIDSIKIKAASNRIKFQPLVDERAQNYAITTQEQHDRKEMWVSKHFVMNKDQTPKDKTTIDGGAIHANHSVEASQKIRQKQYGSNMYFSRGKQQQQVNNTASKSQKRGRYIGGVADDIQLISPEILQEKLNLEQQALRVIHKFGQGIGANQINSNNFSSQTQFVNQSFNTIQ